jgi:hypothetical protein
VGVDSTHVGIFQETKLYLGSLLHSKHGGSLQKDETLKGQLANQQFHRFRAAVNPAKNDRSRAPGGNGAGADLRVAFAARCFRRAFLSGGLSGGFLGTGHHDNTTARKTRIGEKFYRKEFKVR